MGFGTWFCPLCRLNLYTETDADVEQHTATHAAQKPLTDLPHDGHGPMTTAEVREKILRRYSNLPHTKDLTYMGVPVRVDPSMKPGEWNVGIDWGESPAARLLPLVIDAPYAGPPRIGKSLLPGDDAKAPDVNSYRWYCHICKVGGSSAICSSVTTHRPAIPTSAQACSRRTP